MSDTSGISELYRLHSDGQSKYVYFLLAAAGASMGYGLQQLDGLSLDRTNALGVIAVLFWLLSFFFGCKRITWVHSAIYANYSLLQLRQGVHPDQPPHPELTEAAIRGVRTAVETTTNKAARYTKLQFWSLAIGVLLFVGWRILQMI